MKAAPAATAGVARYPDDLRALADDYLRALRFSEDPATAGLDEAMRYSLLAGGKRIRPVLTLATARAVGGSPQDVLPTAAAIELVHTYSLIHDDLPAMDDDELRRGRPTCHIAFGENVAILAGDGLMAEAYRLILERQEGGADAVTSALRAISDAIGVGGMVGGQYVDVAGEAELDAAGLQHMHSLKTGRLIGASVAVAPLLLGAGARACDALDRFAGELGLLFQIVDDILDAAGLQHMHSLKTGRLIGASVAVAPLLLGAGARACDALDRFAAELGLLFQIVDDILDVTGSAAEMGKPAGSDERLGKRTYVSVFGLERARELAAASHERARSALDAAREELAGDEADLRLMTDFMYARNS